MISVLAISPRVPDLPALATDKELAAIGDTPGVRVDAITDVTRARIIDRLSRGQYDVLLWIGHGEPGLLRLAERETVDPQWLASQLAGRVGLAMIAACESGQRADRYSGQSFAEVLPSYGIDTITMATQVGDRAAQEYSVAVLQALATSTTLRRAHSIGVARAGLHGDLQAPQLTPRDGQTAMPAYEVEQGVRMNDVALQSVSGKIERMTDIVNDIRAEQAALKATQLAMQRELTELKNEVHLLRAGVAFPRAYIVASVAAMLVFFLLLVVVTWRVL